MALGLAAVVAAIGIGAVKVSGQWLSPGVMILPILAGGLLLWPRALRILIAFVAVMLAYDAAQQAGWTRHSRDNWHHGALCGCAGADQGQARDAGPAR